MNAIGKRRLLKLADFLETKVPPERFDMDLWGKGNEEGTPRCNSAACALGWASAIPSLRRAGVRLRADGFNGIEGDSFYAAQRVFGMDQDEYNEIFYPGDTDKLKGKDGAQVVAGRIRKLVAASKP